MADSDLRRRKIDNDSEVNGGGDSADEQQDLIGDRRPELSTAESSDHVSYLIECFLDRLNAMICSPTNQENNKTKKIQPNINRG